MCFGLSLAGLMIVFYAVPYRASAGGPGTGELTMSLMVGGLLVLTGALAWWGPGARTERPADGHGTAL